MDTHFVDADVVAVQTIEAVPRILEVVCRTTGLGFAAVARVTDERWIACAVRDNVQFGLAPGGELQLETTICNEIRQSKKLVVIDHVDADEHFRCHPTPKRYGFQSYISVPITRQDGRFFGTLCAIDPRPARVNTPAVVNMFVLFAELIACHLDAQDRMLELEARVAERTRRLHDLNGALQRAREHERMSLARDLHDGFGQLLTALKFDVAKADKLAGQHATSIVEVRHALTDMATIVDAALDDVDRLVSDLRPRILDTLGCVAASRWLVTQFQHRTALRVRFDVDGDDDMPAEIGTALFRILQEALTNVSRHAQASSVTVHLQLGHDIVLRVADDGCGLTPSDRLKPSAFGLRGIAERVADLQGSMTVDAPSDGGVALTVRIPINQ